MAEDTDPLSRCVQGLERAYRRAGTVPRPSSTGLILSLAQGYEIGRRLTAALERQGDRPVGRKIGFTNPATWREFGLDTPIWAPVYERTVVRAPSAGARIELAGMTAPRIEPEIVLGLDDRGTDPVAVWAAIGFEIVDCHYPGWRFTAAEAVADFGVHAALVVGPVVALDTSAAGERLADVAVRLSRNGREVASGSGRNALGGPLAALAHLQQVLAEQSWAPPLEAGELVSTGTLTPLPAVRPGETWSVEVRGGALGGLELTLS